MNVNVLSIGHFVLESSASYFVVDIYVPAVVLYIAVEFVAKIFLVPV